MTADDRNAPGTSAQREYERRKANDEAKLRAKWGKLGGIAVALSDEKQSTKAWSSGAAGEAAVGARLDGLASESIRVMHDRRIPGSKANIHHIVVTPGGVWVIDTNRYVGPAPLKQVGHVRDAVGEVPVFGVLCFVDAEWGLLADAFTVNGVHVVWPKKLAAMVAKAPDAGVDVAALAEQVAQRFVRA